MYKVQMQKTPSSREEIHPLQYTAIYISNTFQRHCQ
uniref:Uncharacterized protein n=1 Tax=Arundo donax TaxID=35708 RepID=A0A0A9A768_ARUDO